MLEKLDEIEQRYKNLVTELTKPENINNIKKIKEIAKEKNNLEEIINKYNTYKIINKEIKGTEELLEDKELKNIANEEYNKLIVEKERIEQELKVLLIPKDKDDDKNVFLEIRGAAGGDEANIFAGDLFEMYQKYAIANNWEYKVINSIPCGAGGYSQIETKIIGKNVYSKLKYESGSHRVQRVPATESQGRIHTSTATVYVVPEQEDIKIDIKEQDLKIDVYRSSGAGGQSVNTTDSAVRITHLPTGIVVTCQNERSQIKNKEQAMQILKNKIYEETITEKEQEFSKDRRLKIGTGDRSEKIRTYNYPQNRITDHRINFTSMNLDRIMDGKLDEIIEPLIKEDIKRRLESF
ncbi:MAG: peptide chain release factor 1 [Bacilli bacterium]|jgi:peptide chain release factor 1|nr:peptide chain release factor 1 [Bacilli bacterium]